MNDISPFVENMRALLDRIVQARTEWDRQEAEREMADAIQRQARQERAVRDVKLAQSRDSV